MITLQEIAPYLPYNIQLYHGKSGNLRALDGVRKHKDGDIMYYFVDGNTHYATAFYYQMALRSLSDLTKPIKHNGEEFVPIEKLEEILKNPYISCDAIIEAIEVLNEYTNRAYLMPYPITQKLFEWHFDVFGLIERGDAIDINNLTNN